jgi:hypothetical protein
MLEAIVALSLLMSALSVSLPLIFKHGRLLIEQRNYRVALDELANHLDRLTATSAGDLPRALRQLNVSSFTADRLHDAKLTSDLTSADFGRRVTLTLTWKSAQQQKVTLAGWIFASAPAALNSGINGNSKRPASLAEVYDRPTSSKNVDGGDLRQSAFVP